MLLLYPLFHVRLLRWLGLVQRTKVFTRDPLYKVLSNNTPVSSHCCSFRGTRTDSFEKEWIHSRFSWVQVNYWGWVTIRRSCQKVFQLRKYSRHCEEVFGPVRAQVRGSAPFLWFARPISEQVGCKHCLGHPLLRRPGILFVRPRHEKFNNNLRLNFRLKNHTNWNENWNFEFQCWVGKLVPIWSSQLFR